ncbi:unnamed protein product, partial [Adineta steineri]
SLHGSDGRASHEIDVVTLKDIYRNFTFTFILGSRNSSASRGAIRRRILSDRACSAAHKTYSNII